MSQPFVGRCHSASFVTALSRRRARYPPPRHNSTFAGPSGPRARFRIDGDGLSGFGIEDCHRAAARRGWSSAHRKGRLVARPCCIPGVVRFALDFDRCLHQAKVRARVGERRFRWCRVLVQDPLEVVSDTPGKSPESFFGLCSRAQGSGLQPQAGVGEHTTK